MLVGLLFLVSHTENISIPAHYEKLVKYFVVHSKCTFRLIFRFVVCCYVDLLLLNRRFFKNKSKIVNMKKMVSRGLKQDRNLEVAFCKRRDFLWYNKSNVSIYEKNYLGKMLRIQMLINPSLPFVALPPSKKNSRKVLRNIADISRTLNFLSCIQEATYPIVRDRRNRKINKQAVYYKKFPSIFIFTEDGFFASFSIVSLSDSVLESSARCSASFFL